MRNVVGRVLVLLAVLGLVAAACGDDDTAASADTEGASESTEAESGNETSSVSVGLVEAQSGALAEVHGPVAEGVRMAVQEINDSGGFEVDGTPYDFDLVDLDSRSDGAATAAAMRQLVEDDVRYVFGPNSSSLALPAIEISQPAEMIHFSGAGGLHTEGYLRNDDTPLIFGTAQDQSATAETLGEGLLDLGYETIALVNADDGITATNIPLVVEGLEESGMEVVAEVRYPPDTTDLSSFVTRASESDPDVLMHATPPSRSVETLRLAEDTNAADVLAAWVFSPTAIEESGLELPFVSANTAPATDYPADERIDAFADRLSEFAPDLGATKDLVFWGYDFVYMLAEAMELAGTVEDTEAIGESLEAMAYDGVAGLVCFGDAENPRVAIYDSFFASQVDGEVSVEARDRSDECDPEDQVVEYAGP